MAKQDHQDRVILRYRSSETRDNVVGRRSSISTRVRGRRKTAPRGWMDDGNPKSCLEASKRLAIRGRSTMAMPRDRRPSRHPQSF